MLPNKRRVGSGWEPPLPLILAAWWDSSASAKRERFAVHLRYADEHDVLGRVSSFLKALPDAEWVLAHDDDVKR
jgi:hypothetical protein